MFSSAKPLRAYIDDSNLNLRSAPKLYDADKLLNDPMIYITDGMEYDIILTRQVSTVWFAQRNMRPVQYARRCDDRDDHTPPSWKH